MDMQAYLCAEYAGVQRGVCVCVCARVCLCVCACAHICACACACLCVRALGAWRSSGCLPTVQLRPWPSSSGPHLRRAEASRRGARARGRSCLLLFAERATLDACCFFIGFYLIAKVKEQMRVSEGTLPCHTWRKRPLHGQAACSRRTTPRRRTLGTSSMGT